MISLTGLITSLGLGSILLLIGAALIVTLIILAAVYVYWALAWSTIAKKLKCKKGWLAWIPVANLFLVPILAKKKWTWGFMFLVPIANIVFYLIWTWDIFERRGFSGWLSLIPVLCVVPNLGPIAFIAYLVMLGVIAWSK